MHDEIRHKIVECVDWKAMIPLWLVISFGVLCFFSFLVVFSSAVSEMHYLFISSEILIPLWLVSLIYGFVGTLMASAIDRESFVKTKTIHTIVEVEDEPVKAQPTRIRRN